MKAETWNTVIRPALSDKLGRALFIGTPRGRRNHFYELYFAAKSQDDRATFHFATSDGGYVSHNELLAVANDMSRNDFAQEFEASFVDLGSRVYNFFDLEKNVAELAPTPGDPLLIGMDFNVDPMTAVVGQKIGEQCHIIDEIVLRNSNTSQMMQELNRRYRGWEGVVHPDPSASSRKTSAPVGETDLTIIERAGWQVFKNPSQKLVDRINSVNAMLLNANGYRRLFISSRCKHLIRALDRLTYKEDTRVPDKTSGWDHVTDALGYMITAVFPMASRNVVSVQTVYL